MPTTVLKPTEQTDFLSNFWKSRVTLRAELVPGLTQDLVMNSVETAYQAASCAYPSDCRGFIELSPLEAKHLRQKLKIRADWDSVKDQVMLELVKEKFLNPKLARQLIETNNAPLMIENGSGDPYWDEAQFGYGENRLERILMDVRDHLAQILVNL
jgi:predicted NAD-dependent protein-ADP-ribosyltransferase YbiA (DUF1768 family)